MDASFSRRRFLGGLSALGIGALVAACSSSPAAPTSAPSSSAAATPSGATAAGAATPASNAAPAATPATATQPAAQAASSGGAASVAFWDMVWGPPEYIDTGKKLVEQFNQKNPTIKATYQSIPWSSYPQVFTTAVGSGTALDISTAGAYQAVQFFSEGAVVAIDDVIAEMGKDGSLNDFMAGTVDRLKFQGHQVALPWAIDIRLPYYRKDLFEKAGVKEPTTWDELRVAAQKLTSGDVHGWVFTGQSSQPFMSYLLNDAGAFFTPDAKLDVMTDRNVETFTFFANLVKDKSVDPGSAGFTGDDALKAFGSGKAAMVVNQPGLEKRFPDQAQNIVLFTPVAAPHGDKGTISWVNNIMLYKQSKNLDATKTFLTWWSANQKPLWTEGHNAQVPTRNSVAKDDYFQSNPFTKQTLEQWVPIGQSNGAKIPGIAPVLQDFESSGDLNTLTTDILQGMDPKAALQKCEAGLKNHLKKYNV